jgi:hypothetical protein
MKIRYSLFGAALVYTIGNYLGLNIVIQNCPTNIFKNSNN